MPADPNPATSTRHEILVGLHVTDDASYARYRAGQKSTAGVNMDGLRTRFVRSLDLAEEWAAKLR